jgi:hypothetical protein
MDWHEINSLLSREVKAFGQRLLDRVMNEPAPPACLSISSEIKRLSKIQNFFEEPADGACFAFAASLKWPAMRAEVEDAILLRLNSAAALAGFLSGERGRIAEMHPVPCLSSRESALRFVLVDWWHFLGRYPRQDE